MCWSFLQMRNRFWCTISRRILRKNARLLLVGLDLLEKGIKTHIFVRRPKPFQGIPATERKIFVFVAALSYLIPLRFHALCLLRLLLPRYWDTVQNVKSSHERKAFADMMVMSISGGVRYRLTSPSRPSVLLLILVLKRAVERTTWNL